MIDPKHPTERGSDPTRPRVLVVGGANMDVRARSTRPVLAATSNPGVTVQRPGGVGRNIAENLARLGNDVGLVAPLGRDVFGAQLAAHASEAGITMHPVRRASGRTGSYLAVLDEGGELVVAVSDMAVADALTPADVQSAAALLTSMAMLVLDANLPVAVADFLIEKATAADVPVVIEPVSVAKADRLAPLLSPERAILAVTPNVAELAALVGADVPDTAEAVADASAALHRLGVRHVWTRRGPLPSVLSTVGAPIVTVDPPAVPVVDVTGGGDAMTAGFAHCLLRGETAQDAARFGQMLGALTVTTPDTVLADLSDRTVRQALAGRR